MDASSLLDALWDRYSADQPYARRFVELSGGSFRNDHVAFRSLARRNGGVSTFVRLFEGLGWRRAGTLEFPDVHLSAVHLSHPAGLPRVFVSELHAERLPLAARAIIDKLERDPEPVASPEWFARPAARPSRCDLEALDSVSQYAAWLLAFGRSVNHFTASVDDIDAAVARLRANGIPMKTAIEGAPDSPLRQTATAPSLLPVPRADGAAIERPYAYFEIAQRKSPFDGFLDKQARQLFEMTHPDGRGRDAGPAPRDARKGTP